MILIDPNLIDERGHHLAITQRFAAAAIREGMPVTILAHRDVDPAKLHPATTVNGCFPETSYQPMAEGDRRRDLAPGLIEVLGRELARPEARGARLLIHSADGHSLRAAAALLPRLAESRAVLHLITAYAPDTMPGGRAGPGVDAALRHLAQHPQNGRSLFLWAETTRLAAFYSAAYGAQTAWLPLPVPLWAKTLPPPTGPLTFAFLGSAREEKGFSRLPEVVSALSAIPETDVRFEIQSCPPASGLTPGCAAALATLSQRSDVRLHPGVLAEPDYATILARSDAVILPYAPASYALRGSGIAVEALAAGRSLLATAGTEAAEMAPADLLLSADTAAEWTAQARRLAAELPARRARMAAAGTAFRLHRSASAGLHRLIARETLGSLLSPEGVRATPMLGLVDLPPIGR